MSILTETLEANRVVTQSLARLESQLDCAADLVGRCLRGGHKLLVCGNGGSASDGAHFATEFVSRFLTDRRPYPVMTLTGEGGLLTSLGNDYSFDLVFARQVRGFGSKGDVLVVFTTSGKSRNVLLALEESKKLGIESVAFLGKGGGFTGGVATVDLLVESDSTPRVQEAHKVLFHALCEMVDMTLPKT